jgi:hypothetical protein
METRTAVMTPQIFNAAQAAPTDASSGWHACACAGLGVEARLRNEGDAEMPLQIHTP